jgi:signal transduction histidine kinase
MAISERHAPQRSLLRYGFYSLVFNAAIAVLLTAVGLGDRMHPDLIDRFFVNFVYSQCVGLPAWFLIDAPRHLLWPAERPRLLTFLPIVIASMLVATYGGTWLGTLLLGHPWTLRTPLTSLLITATAGFLAVMYFWERGRAERIERQIAEARLKLLQAQIEPHFLFNTLANLDALIGIDPPRARTMLGHLNDYLRATLASARNERNTLGDEFKLLAGYLEVIGVRMGPRLSFSLDLPEALQGKEVPPMLLQPLVENAIKHGLEPKMDGGRIEIAARAEGARLVITIADTGIGLGGNQSPGTNLGLNNVRERIAAAYGGAASLDVAARPGGGVTVTLSIPQEQK